MNLIWKKVSLLAFFAWVLVGANAQTAQKIGHLNAGNLLSMMPETPLADTALVKYRDSLVVFGDSVATKFKERADAFMKDYQAGKIPPAEAEKMQERLRREQAGIQGFAQKIDQAINIRRQVLLAPILERIDKALKEVAKENAFDMVFDEGSGAMLYTTGSQDVTPLVKAKLGLK